MHGGTTALQPRQHFARTEHRRQARERARPTDIDRPVAPGGRATAARARVQLGGENAMALVQRGGDEAAEWRAQPDHAPHGAIGPEQVIKHLIVALIGREVVQVERV